MRIFIPVITLLVCFTSCKGCWNQTPPESENIHSLPPDSLSYEMVDKNLQWGDCEKGESNCIALTAEFPRLTGADSLSQELNAYIEKWILGSMKDSVTSLDELMNLYVAEYQRLQKQPQGYNTGWQVEKQISVLMNHHGIFSMRLEEIESTGGAHPNMQTWFANFDLHQNRMLRIEDFLAAGYEDTLGVLAEFYFRQSRELSFEDDLAEAGFNFRENKFNLKENFVLDETGLTFVFSPYDVGSAGSGLSEFTIPYAELIKTDLIREDGPLSFLISEPAA